MTKIDYNTSHKDYYCQVTLDNNKTIHTKIICAISYKKDDGSTREEYYTTDGKFYDTSRVKILSRKVSKEIRMEELAWHYKKKYNRVKTDLNYKEKLHLGFIKSCYNLTIRRILLVLEETPHIALLSKDLVTRDLASSILKTKSADKLLKLVQALDSFTKSEISDFLKKS